MSEDYEKEFKRNVAAAVGKKYSEITPETNFMKDLTATSTQMYAISSLMEDLAGKPVSFSDANGCETVGDALNLIKKLREEES